MISPSIIERAPCTPNSPLRVGVLVSGHGSNLQALLNTSLKGTRPFVISHVISNEKDAFALKRAEHAGVSHETIDHKSLSSRQDFDRALVASFLTKNIELVVLAGFMRLLTQDFLAAFTNRAINVHPSLLPSFPGIHAAKQALEYGVRITGCSVHIVDSGADTGPIIAQSACEVFEEDDLTALQRRIQAREHKLLPQIVRAIAKGAIRFDGQKVTFDEREKFVGHLID